MQCYKCGRPADQLIDGDSSAVCNTCEQDYQAWLVATYPLGQCGQCGAEYREVRCALGTTHTVAFHAEGACGQWRDYGDYDGDQCPYGGHPLPSPSRPLDPADLPF